MPDSETSGGRQIKSIMDGYLRDTDNLRRLAKDLVRYALMSKHCGYSTEEGIVPDASHAALMLEFLADALDTDDA